MQAAWHTLGAHTSLASLALLDLPVSPRASPPWLSRINFAFVPPAQRILYCNVIYVSSETVSSRKGRGWLLLVISDDNAQSARARDAGACLRLVVVAGFA
jgi:hypothetical protein